MLELLGYRFFINALVTALLTSISCGIIGTYIVSKRMVFLSGGITHASFGGIGLGYLLGFNPVLGAALFGVASALGIGVLSRRTSVREDTLIGIWWSFGMALGIIFIFITPGYAPNLMMYLFGNILTVSGFDIGALVVICCLVVLVFALMLNEILFISFDEEFARVQKVPAELLYYLLLVLTTLTIVINIRVVGIILVISLLTIPQATAGQLTASFKKQIGLSILFALIASLSGLFISYGLNIPSGASIIFSAAVLFIIVFSIKRLLQQRKVLQELGHIDSHEAENNRR